MGCEKQKTKSCYRKDRDFYLVECQQFIVKMTPTFQKHIKSQQLACSVHVVTTITFPEWENMGKFLMFIFLMFQGKCSTQEIILSNVKQLCTKHWQDIYRSLRYFKVEKEKPNHWTA